MQSVEDLTYYDNRLNLVRMEMEQLLNPLRLWRSCKVSVTTSTTVHFLSTGVVDVVTLDDVIQHDRDFMLIALGRVDALIAVFRADVDSPPPLPSSDIVQHGAVITQLTTLTAQMKALADSVAALAATSRRPRPNDLREIIVCSYVDKRGHV
jgi:hypothetical protein